MKISELIATLQRALGDHGDLEVMRGCWEWGHETVDTIVVDSTSWPGEAKLVVEPTTTKKHTIIR